jgi:hypothetical protein
LFSSPILDLWIFCFFSVFYCLFCGARPQGNYQSCTPIVLSNCNCVPLCCSCIMIYKKPRSTEI